MKSPLISLLSLCVLLFNACRVRPEWEGTWKRGSMSEITISGNKGTLKGKNGATLSLDLDYREDGSLIIKEKGHNPAFLENYLPKEIAPIAATNTTVTNTTYHVTIDTNGIIQARIKAWEAWYDHDKRLYYIEPITFTEVWGTNKEQP